MKNIGELIIQKSRGLTLDVYEDEAILHNQTDETIVVLNSTAFLLWKMMDDNNTYENLRNNYLKCFDDEVDLNKFDHDFKMIIKKLAKYKMITIHSNIQEGMYD